MSLKSEFKRLRFWILKFELWMLKFEIGVLLWQRQSV